MLLTAAALNTVPTVFYIFILLLQTPKIYAFIHKKFILVDLVTIFSPHQNLHKTTTTAVYSATTYYTHVPLLPLQQQEFSHVWMILYSSSSRNEKS